MSDPNFVNSGIPTGLYSKLSGKISIFPNPANDVLNIMFDHFTMLQNGYIILYNEAGQEILKQVADKDLTTLDISGLAAGTYFLQATNNSEIILSAKFVKTE